MTEIMTYQPVSEEDLRDAYPSLIPRLEVPLTDEERREMLFESHSLDVDIKAHEEETKAAADAAKAKLKSLQARKDRVVEALARNHRVRKDVETLARYELDGDMQPSFEAHYERIVDPETGTNTPFFRKIYQRELSVTEKTDLLSQMARNANAVTEKNRHQ